MLLLLSLCLLADGGVPPEGGLELKVYRSKKELPAAWAALLPQDFDFRKEMLASRARPEEPLEFLAPARTDRHRGVVHLWEQPPAPSVRECPPCRGVELMDRRDLDAEWKAPPVPVYRVPRARGKVVLHLVLEPLNAPDCVPCLAQ